MLVAGGSVLASLWPLPPNYKRLKPFAYDWCEFDLYGQRVRSISGDEPERTREQFLRESLCSTSDIDVFVHGLSAEAAQRKMVAIMTQLRRTLVRAFGIENDIYFVKTSNTISELTAART